MKISVQILPYRGHSYQTIYQSLLDSSSEMASTDMRDLLRLMGQQLQVLDMEELKHILQDSFAGEFLWVS